MEIFRALLYSPCSLVMPYCIDARELLADDTLQACLVTTQRVSGVPRLEDLFLGLYRLRGLYTTVNALLTA